LKDNSVRFSGKCQDEPVTKAGQRRKIDKIGSQSQPISNPKEWVSQAEAARMRGVTRQAIRKLVLKGRLSTVEIGGSVLVKKTEVENFRPAQSGRKAKSK